MILLNILNTTVVCPLTSLPAINVYNKNLFWRGFFEDGAITAWCNLTWTRTQNKFRTRCPCAFPMDLPCIQWQDHVAQKWKALDPDIKKRFIRQLTPDALFKSALSLTTWVANKLFTVLSIAVYPMLRRVCCVLCSLVDAVSLIRFLYSSLCLTSFFADKKILTTYSGFLQISQSRRTQKRRANAERGATLASRAETTWQLPTTTRWYILASCHICSAHRKSECWMICIIIKLFWGGQIIVLVSYLENYLCNNAPTNQIGLQIFSINRFHESFISSGVFHPFLLFWLKPLNDQTAAAQQEERLPFGSCFMRSTNICTH